MLPWKYGTPYLPNNKFMAEKRKELFKKPLKRDPKPLARYKETVGDYPSDGVPVWYLPLHPVAHP